MELKDMLRQLRKENRYTQAQLAELLGMTQAGYNRYEAGAREPDLDSILRIADFYGISTDYLLGRVDTPYYLFPVNGVPVLSPHKPGAIPDGPCDAMPRDTEALRRFVLELIRQEKHGG